MDYLASMPTIKKVQIYAGGALVKEEAVNVDKFVGDLFKQVFQDYQYVYIKSEKALEYNSVAEHRLYEHQWLSSVLVKLDLLEQDVIEIHAEPAALRMRELFIYGGADDKHTDDEYWTRRTFEVVHYKLGALIAPVFAMYNFVYIKTPVGHDVSIFRLNREMRLKDVIAELKLLEGVIVIHAYNISGP